MYRLTDADKVTIAQVLSKLDLDYQPLTIDDDFIELDRMLTAKEIEAAIVMMTELLPHLSLKSGAEYSEDEMVYHFRMRKSLAYSCEYYDELVNRRYFRLIWDYGVY